MVFAATMGHSTALVATVAGGVLQIIYRTTLGTANCIAPMAVLPGTKSTASRMLSLSVASGIDNLSAAADRPPTADEIFLRKFEMLNFFIKLISLHQF